MDITYILRYDAGSYLEHNYRFDLCGFDAISVSDVVWMKLCAAGNDMGTYVIFSSMRLMDQYEI